MNIIEEGTVNRENYEIYLNRMRLSFSLSSKQLLISNSYFYRRILDVGCGDGALIGLINEHQKEFGIEGDFLGIDLNFQSISRCPSLPNADFEMRELEDVVESIENNALEPFDCVIFSSVLHEISSYSPADAYTLNPIRIALDLARRCLRDDGVVIIRDGVKSKNKEEYTIKFEYPEDIRFVSEFISCSPAEQTFRFPLNIYFNSDSCTAPWCWLQEFLRTYTWGEGSWYREVREINGIATKEEWKEIIEENGFRIIREDFFEDRYSRYLDEKVEIFDGNRRISLVSLMQEMNGIWIARKV